MGKVLSKLSLNRSLNIDIRPCNRIIWIFRKYDQVWVADHPSAAYYSGTSAVLDVKKYSWGKLLSVSAFYTMTVKYVHCGRGRVFEFFCSQQYADTDRVWISPRSSTLLTPNHRHKRDIVCFFHTSFTLQYSIPMVFTYPVHTFFAIFVTTFF